MGLISLWISRRSLSDGTSSLSLSLSLATMPSPPIPYLTAYLTLLS